MIAGARCALLSWLDVESDQMRRPSISKKKWGSDQLLIPISFWRTYFRSWQMGYTESIALPRGQGCYCTLYYHSHIIYEPYLFTNISVLCIVCLMHMHTIDDGLWGKQRSQGEKMAFITHQGLFEFRVMAFDLWNGRAVSQRLMQNVFAGSQISSLSTWW